MQLWALLRAIARKPLITREPQTQAKPVKPQSL